MEKLPDLYEEIIESKIIEDYIGTVINTSNNFIIPIICTPKNLWRLFRLACIVGYVEAKQEDICQKIEILCDFEDMLTVVWKEEPTDTEEEVFTSIYKSKIGSGLIGTNLHLTKNSNPVYFLLYMDYFQLSKELITRSRNVYRN